MEFGTAVAWTKRGKARGESGVWKGSGLEVLCRPCSWVCTFSMEQRGQSKKARRLVSGLLKQFT